MQLPPDSIVPLGQASVNATLTVVPVAATETTHEPTPLHGDAHEKTEFGSGVAIAVTWVPAAIVAEQVPPQDRLPPLHVALTVPEPLPVLSTLKVPFLTVKVAVTWVAPLMDETVQDDPEVVLQPFQLWNSKFEAGLACKVTLDPLSSWTVQGGLVQLIPPDPVTVPEPLVWIVRAYFLRANVTVTCVAALIAFTLHVVPLADEQP